MKHHSRLLHSSSDKHHRTSEQLSRESASFRNSLKSFVTCSSSEASLRSRCSFFETASFPSRVQPDCSDLSSRLSNDSYLSEVQDLIGEVRKLRGLVCRNDEKDLQNAPENSRSSHHKKVYQDQISLNKQHIRMLKQQNRELKAKLLGIESEERLIRENLQLRKQLETAKSCYQTFSFH